jgi:hypothetical protein
MVPVDQARKFCRNIMGEKSLHSDGQQSKKSVGIQLSEGRVGIHYQREGRVEIPLTGLTLPHFCACLKPGPLFPMSYFMVSFVFNCLRLEAIFCFVDHHCVNFFPP